MLNVVSIDHQIKVRNPADLLVSLPTVVVVNKFTEESAKVFNADMNRAFQSGQKVIPVFIDSYGGEVYSLLSMIDTIRVSKVPVATIVAGKAMSCGALLFSFGTEGYRFMGPTSTLMIHDVSKGTHGKIEEIKADVGEAERLNQMVFKMMAQNCGHHDSYFLDLIHDKNHADWYLTPSDAKDHKLCNHIRLPEMKTSVSVETHFK